MDHETLRLRCLEIARAEGLTHGEMIQRAQVLFDFVRFGQDGASETRRMVAGVDKPEAARVVGRDGDFEKPFRDYLTKPPKPE